MFKDHELNLSLVISFLWHLMLACMITIVTGSMKVSHKNMTTVAFLGQLIPQESKFTVDLTKGPYPLEPREKNARLLYDESRLRLTEIEREGEFWQDSFIAGRLNPINTIPDEGLRIEKAMPDLYPAFEERKKLETRPSDFDGQLASREIIYKPDMSDAMGSLKLSAIDADSAISALVLKVYVANDGRVAKVEKLASSGIPELDRCGIKYMRLWQFASVSKKDEPFKCGVIRLDFGEAK